MILPALVAFGQEIGKERETMKLTSAGLLSARRGCCCVLKAMQKHTSFVEDKR